MVWVSHPYNTTGKTIDLIRRTSVGKVMSWIFNMLSKMVTAFLPRGTCLNFMAVVTICSDLGALENKVCHCSHCLPIYLPWCHLMRRVDSLEMTLMLGGIGGRREGDDRGWDGWIASLTRWTWVWVNSRSWWWTGRLGVLRFMGSQRVGHD